MIVLKERDTIISLSITVSNSKSRKREPVPTQLNQHRTQSRNPYQRQELEKTSMTPTSLNTVSGNSS